MDPKALAAILLDVTSDVGANPNAPISRRHIVEIANRLNTAEPAPAAVPPAPAA